MNILEKIILTKQKEVKERKESIPVNILEKSIFFRYNPLSLKAELVKKPFPAIIAEYKRKSPSKGIINDISDVSEVCRGYEMGGAAAVSVLTDKEYFGGSSEDLSEARKSINCPILRKDFIIDEYQIIEARSLGADAILLIAEILPDARIESLFRFAKSLGLEALVEVHGKENLPRIPYDAEVIGINSRDLGTFEVNKEHLSRLVTMLPATVVKVAESGIKSPADVLSLSSDGFDAFLIGENFMSRQDPAKACKDFIDTLGYQPDVSAEVIKK